MSSVDHHKVFAAFQAARGTSTSHSAPKAGSIELSSDERQLLEELLAHDSPTDVFLGTDVKETTIRLVSPLLSNFEGSSLGQYRIVRDLGEGTFGQVFLCEQPGTQRLVAVKVLRHLVSNSAVDRFALEARSLAQLNHEGITAIHESFTWNGLRCIAMEYVDGTPIDEYCQSKCLGTQETVSLILAVCQALSHAHKRGLIHRDLAPKHILVTNEGKPKLLDFGLARWLNDSSTLPTRTLPGTVVGTLAFASPEQLKPEESVVDTRSDVYALGVIAHLLLVGQHPYLRGGESLGQAVSRLSDAKLESIEIKTKGRIGHGLTSVLRKSVDRSILSRYQSVDELASDLHAVLESRPIAASRSSVLVNCRSLIQRKPRLALGLVLGIVMATGLSLYGWQLSVRESDARESALRSAQLVVDRMLSPLAPQIGTLSDREALLAAIQSDVRAISASLPSDSRNQRLVAGFCCALGDVHRERGRLAESLRCYSEAEVIYAALNGKFPLDFDLQRAWSFARVKSGDVLQRMGEQDRAYARYEESLLADEQLASIHPANLAAQSDFYWSCSRVALHQNCSEQRRGALLAKARIIASSMLQIAQDDARSIAADLNSILLDWNRRPQNTESPELLDRALVRAEQLVALDARSVTHNATLLLVLVRILDRTNARHNPVLWRQIAEKANGAETRLRANVGVGEVELEVLTNASVSIARGALALNERDLAMERIDTAVSDFARLIKTNDTFCAKSIDFATTLSQLGIQQDFGQQDDALARHITTRLKDLADCVDACVEFASARSLSDAIRSLSVLSYRSQMSKRSAEQSNR